MGKPRLPYADSPKGMSKRAMSGAYTHVNTGQVKELKEAFELLDQDGNGTISREDLAETLKSVGQVADTETIDKMMQQMNEPLTFSAYLNGMSALHQDMASRPDLLAAFQALEPGASANLANSGGTLNAQDLEEAIRDAGVLSADIARIFPHFTIKSGFTGNKFDYKKFVDTLRPE